MGTFGPKLGTSMIDKLSRTIFGQTRSAVLGVLFGHVDESFYLRQLVRTTGAGKGAVQREVKELSDAGLISKTLVGNQTFYQANQSSPIFSEIKSLVTKTVGVHDVLRTALNPFRKDIQAAFVYGSIAKQTETPKSDIDLMVVGNIDFDRISARLHEAQKRLNREINPSLYPEAELRQKIASGNHFLRTVLSGEKIFIFGDESEFRRLGEHQPLVRKDKKQPRSNQGALLRS
jgi:predicted nucleotidyltransferase